MPRDVQNYESSFILLIGAQSTIYGTTDVSNSILRIVCEAYLLKDSGTVVGYRIGYRRFLIIICKMSKVFRLFAVLTK